MRLWLVRAGKYGEREDFALQNQVALIGWPELPDLTGLETRKALNSLLQKTYPDRKPKTLSMWEGQVWAFVHDMALNDLVALPLKHRAAIAIGQVTGEYCYAKDNPPDARHTRPVQWLTQLPRNQFDPDLLYSLGAAMTVCRIQRNQAAERVQALLTGKTKPGPAAAPASSEAEAEPDLEQLAGDQITNYINRKFKGHGLTRLVAAVLQAQGYQVRVSPEGPDGGVDILAGRGGLGFETPRLVVQVKSGDSEVDVNVVRELQGVMHSFGADQGLIVAWSGYRGTVEKEAARNFFKIRLWDAADLVQKVQEHYDQLPDAIQAELPLKRIWTIVMEEE